VNARHEALAFTAFAFVLAVAPASVAADCAQNEPRALEREVVERSSGERSALTLHIRDGRAHIASHDGIERRVVALKKLDRETCARVLSLILDEIGRTQVNDDASSSEQPALPDVAEPSRPERTEQPQASEPPSPVNDTSSREAPAISARARIGAAFGARRVLPSGETSWAVGPFFEQHVADDRFAVVLQADVSSWSSEVRLGHVRATTAQILAGAAIRPKLGALRGDAGAGVRSGIVWASARAGQGAASSEHAAPWTGPSAWIGVRAPLGWGLEIGVRTEATYSLRPIRIAAAESVQALQVWLLGQIGVAYAF